MKPLLFASLFAQATLAYSADLSVAVAANFTTSFKQISEVFHQQTGITINASNASSGQLFAQIKHGANYDIFFSADAQRPEQLLLEGIGLGPTQIYAYGQLALYSQPAINCAHWQRTLQQAQINNIALANPKLAPFGVAATQVLTASNINPQAMPLASNAAIPLNWLYSGSVEHALSSLSFSHKMPNTVSICSLPTGLYAPIEQHLLALNARPETLQLTHFMRSNTVNQILLANGYTAHHD